MYLYVYIRCSAATLSLSLQSVQYFFLYHIDGSSDSIFVVVLSFLGVLMALTFLKCMVVVAAVIITEEFMQYMYICVCFLKLRFRCVCVFLMYYIENLVLLLLLFS